jgi:hypothetical protein
MFLFPISIPDWFPAYTVLITQRRFFTMTKKTIFEGLQELFAGREEYTQKEFEKALVEYHKTYAGELTPDEWREMVRKIQFDLISV